MQVERLLPALERLRGAALGMKHHFSCLVLVRHCCCWSYMWLGVIAIQCVERVHTAETCIRAAVIQSTY